MNEPIWPTHPTRRRRAVAPAAGITPAQAGRRRLLQSALGAGLLVCLRPAAVASEGELAAAIRAFTSGAPVMTGKVQLEIAPLVENGNAVPLTVRVSSPMTVGDHVRAIGIFNERNPQPEVAVFTLGPRAGLPQVATRIRLATSQKLVAVARLSDGSHWQASVDVLVTLAACIES